jgi:hypothetical protein
MLIIDYKNNNRKSQTSAITPRICIQLHFRSTIYHMLAKMAYPSRVPEFTPWFFCGVRVTHLFSFLLSYYVSKLRNSAFIFFLCLTILKRSWSDSSEYHLTIIMNSWDGEYHLTIIMNSWNSEYHFTIIMNSWDGEHHLNHHELMGWWVSSHNHHELMGWWVSSHNHHEIIGWWVSYHSHHEIIR